MEVTPELIRHLERLSRIQLTPEEEARMQEDLGRILGYFEKISALDTDGLEEMARPVPLENRMRADEARESLAQAEALSVAVEAEDGFFKVPRVIE
ncbi:Asp-tRNA(Asn)/Glu-tRNA(Gln) amidotransferase subunit GatC [Marinithermus hydrothermalis]|uniref:Aspartyl/glutamyl-tRNA(Asn/Gln) amidotransferase subunit C n=1 Tax=Marinithermus hydrothermalis (strain DSM 14884 / JCM 11576 / T1) TaxID=869210 RepID=F2NK18_MARHT|nr:Asp-tRNA(Asn)/Glu-tRNA(Gln) amidotransferase subunit GatC [Marinithermus hydrothermalis]AEB11989.1 Aspartyl/glutamyl-tRNA(Asn/Gln) amidotransferase subunit C [Marinithermus hydrothermalis DSM 14884]